MKKKIILAISVILSIMLVTSAVSIAIKTNNTKVNDKDQSKYYKTSLRGHGGFLDKYVTMEEPPELPDQSGADPKPEIIDTPDEFSWKNIDGKDYTSPAKHQGACGSCWDFAAMGILEAIIEIREDCSDLNPDLSEQYVLSCIEGAGSCRGGSTSQALEKLIEVSPDGNNCNGIIPESCFPYEADDDIPCSAKCSDWEEKLIPIEDTGYWRVDGSSDDIAAMKTEIYQNGPIASNIMATDLFKIWGSTSHDPNDYYPFLKNTYGSNHIVVILGWKDDPSIRKGGYWICKNSWGTDWGYNGYFNIEYNALSIDNMMIVTVEYNPESYNWAPYANAGGGYGGLKGQVITFDATGSIGYEGDIVEYHWDFGDDTQGTGAKVTHSYSEVGEYTVTLTVTDNKNNEGTDEATVFIQNSNQPPSTPTIDGPSAGTAHSHIDYVLYSEDPNGNGIYYYVDWDDGYIDEWIGPYPSGEEITVTHLWSARGTYNVQVKAKDAFDAESDWGTLSVTMPRERFQIMQLFFRILDKIFSDFFY